MSYYPRRAGNPAQEPVTLAEALEHLREDAGVADAYINRLIGTAREACENRTERTLISCDWKVTLDAFPDAIVLYRPPIISVTSVKYFDVDGVEQTLDPADYLLDSVSEPGYLVPAPGKDWPTTQDRINAVTVTYSAGYGTTAASVPKPLVQWILLAIGEMNTNRTLSNDPPDVPQGFAQSLLDPYLIWRL